MNKRLYLPLFFALASMCSCEMGAKDKTNEPEQSEVRISLSSSEYNLKTGDTGEITATVTPNGNHTITWTKNEMDYFSIEPYDNRLVIHGNSPGEGVVTASIGSISASCRVVVSNYAVDSDSEITIWVEKQSVDFYERVIEAYESSNADSGFDIKVSSIDTGMGGALMLSDNKKCADIITISNDNIGRLSERGLIKPLSDEDLLAQIEADNSDTFKPVIKSTVADLDGEFIMGSPYISHTLFLIYDKRYVSEEQSKTFEGLREAALQFREIQPEKHSNVYGCTFTGTDGYNFSFSLLARKADDYSTTLKIYENFDAMNTFCQGDDTVAVTKWAQRSFADGTLIFPNDSGYVSMMQNQTALSVIGARWHYDSIKEAIGEENVGVTFIPEFTLSSTDVEGTTMEPNTKMRGGTFKDCKCFAINAASNSAKYQIEQDLIKLLSSKEIQNRSFNECGNIPTHKDAMEYIESAKGEVAKSVYEIATAQFGMEPFGIVQPFVTSALSDNYYKSGTPDLYRNLLNTEYNPENVNIRRIREVLFIIEYLWQFGTDGVDRPIVPETLPAEPVKII